MSGVARQRKDDRTVSKSHDVELDVDAAGGTMPSGLKPSRRGLLLRVAGMRPVSSAVKVVVLALAVIGAVTTVRTFFSFFRSASHPGTLGTAPDGAAAGAQWNDPDAKGLHDASAKWEAEHDREVAAVLERANNGLEHPADPPLQDQGSANGLGDNALPPGFQNSNSDSGRRNVHLNNAMANPIGNGARQQDALAPDSALQGQAQAGGPMHRQQRELGPRCITKFEPGRLGSDKVLCVTDEFYFDILLDEEDAGRFVIGVFGDVVPQSSANFRALATCTGAFSDERLCFKGDFFHRVVKDFVIQGGSKATGRSIYGPTFREEKAPEHHSFLSHDEKGVVSWAEYPIGSQFYITTTPRNLSYLDKNHVVFGIVTDGMAVVNQIAALPTVGDSNESPTKRVTIADCGDLHAPPAAPA